MLSNIAILRSSFAYGIPRTRDHIPQQSRIGRMANRLFESQVWSILTGGSASSRLHRSSIPSRLVRRRSGTQTPRDPISAHTPIEKRPILWGSQVAWEKLLRRLIFTCMCNGRSDSTKNKRKHAFVGTVMLSSAADTSFSGRMTKTHLFESYGGPNVYEVRHIRSLQVSAAPNNIERLGLAPAGGSSRDGTQLGARRGWIGS